MRKSIRWGLTLVILAGLVAGFLWLRQRSTATDTPEILKTGEVTRGDLRISISASGTVAVRRVSHVISNATGRAEQVLVSREERVTEGQVLAIIDQTDLQRAVRQAEIAVEQAEIARDTAQRPADDAQVRLAELALKSATEALELARIGTETARVDAGALIVQAQRQREQAYIRLRDAHDGEEKNDAQTAYEQAETEEQITRLNADLTQKSADAQYQAALISYTQAQDALDTLTRPADEDTVQQRALEVEQAQLRLQQAQRALKDAEITAPHSGVVAEIDIAEGTVQRAGDPAFTILDDSEIYVDTTIDEIDIGAVAVGQEAILVPDAYPDVTLAGVVESVAPASTNVGGLVAYDVRIKMSSAEDLRLLEGMAINAQIVTATLEDRTLVPAWAVRSDETTRETYCLKLVGVATQRVSVQLGQSNETYAEVTGGLTVGDTVVLVATERSLFDVASQGAVAPRSWE